MEGTKEEALVRREVEELQKRLGKKNTFEEAVSSLKSLLSARYPSASPPLRKLLYSAVCRVATILKTRYTSPAFWLAGLRLFQVAETFVSDPAQKDHLKACLAQALEHSSSDSSADVNPSNSNHSDTRGGFLFEGHLTVDPEPPRPPWLVLQSNVLDALSSAQSSNTHAPHVDSRDGDTPSSSATVLFQELIQSLDTTLLPQILEGDVAAVRKVPPASREVVAKLPVITLTSEILAKLEKGIKCAICQEDLVVDDKMQELPCNHTFHPPCLKPWLDEHNSCPICRHELQTDDHAYESWKERQKELDEERKGAANAVRGGEYMYV